MSHIAFIEINQDGHWVITLKGGAVIEGTRNLAQTVEKLESYIWPQPVLSKDWSQNEKTI